MLNSKFEAGNSHYWTPAAPSISISTPSRANRLWPFRLIFEFRISTFESSPLRAAFTLIELLVSVGIVATLAALSFAGFTQVKSISQGACCANSLRQLGAATSMYLSDHQHVCFQYAQVEDTGKLWYFGFETWASIDSPEGFRSVDQTQGPLYPYIQQVGGIQVCPAFPYYQSISMLKYSGASWGYGYNIFLSGESIFNIPHPSQVMLFGDCAQVDTFQPPASPTHPLLEEFYMLDDGSFYSQTIHFRHSSCANILFLDGHVEKFTMAPGTQTTLLPSAHVGRITPFGSTMYFQ